MLTDIFSIRYENTPLFKAFLRREKRILHQCFTILEELHPYWPEEKGSKKSSANFWEEAHKRVANELGERWLSEPWFQTQVGVAEYRRTETRQRPYIEICRNWVCRAPTSNANADEFIKDRISLVEIGLRIVYERIEGYKKSLKQEEPFSSLLKISYESQITAYENAAQELNTRLSDAKYSLHYHNGFIQIQRDEISSTEIEQPFWSLVSEPLWENVDLDMKEAIDQRDIGGKDPAFYAARALESAIKIISDELRTSHGRENGAHNFIDNIAKKSVAFLSDWESQFLKDYFSKVRNPLGHGPGKDPMPTLNPEQTNWAIETAMSWIKLMVERHSIKTPQMVAP